MMNKTIRLIIIISSIALLFGCSKKQNDTKGTIDEKEDSVSKNSDDSIAKKDELNIISDRIPEDVIIYLYSASRTEQAMNEVADKFELLYPTITVSRNYASTSNNIKRIKSRKNCDVILSGSRDAINKEVKNGNVVKGSTKDLFDNQLIVISAKDSDTKVTGLENISNASSIGMVESGMSIGALTRKSLVGLGVLDKIDDPVKYTSEQMSKMLGVEVYGDFSESDAVQAVLYGTCEVSVVYYSSISGHEDELKIIEKIPYDLSGHAIYTVGQVKNEEATYYQIMATQDFIEFIKSDEAKEIFKSYNYDTK